MAVNLGIYISSGIFDGGSAQIWADGGYKSQNWVVNLLGVQKSKLTLSTKPRTCNALRTRKADSEPGENKCECMSVCVGMCA